MENYREGIQRQTDNHIIVRKTRSNGYEFATTELGVFNFSKQKQLNKFMNRKKWTYNIVNKKSRMI